MHSLPSKVWQCGLVSTAAAALVLLWLGCTQEQVTRSQPGAGSAVVRPKATAPTSFYLGADVSALGAPGRGGRSGARVYQENGVPSDEVTVLKNHG